MSDAPLPSRDSPRGGDSGRPNVQGDESYPNRLPVANSDDAPRSPWFKKLVLSLGKFTLRFHDSPFASLHLLCGADEYQTAVESAATVLCSFSGGCCASSQTWRAVTGTTYLNLTSVKTGPRYVSPSTC